jgi:hypothetical protein
VKYSGYNSEGGTSLDPDARRQYIDSIIDTLRAHELNAGPAHPISDFDKTRLSASLDRWCMMPDGQCSGYKQAYRRVGASPSICGRRLECKCR